LLISCPQHAFPLGGAKVEEQFLLGVGLDQIKLAVRLHIVEGFKLLDDFLKT